jgi:hypothetical protein
VRSRVHVYLLLEHSAFQIDADYLNRGWQSVLSPPGNPDLFELLGRPDSTLDGRSYHSAIGAGWAPVVEEFLRDRTRVYRGMLELPADGEPDALEFVRLFWKLMQLAIVLRSAQKGEVGYPLTLPAISRALARQGMSLPPGLASLADVYRDALEGKACAIRTLIPEALSYLRAL